MAASNTREIIKKYNIRLTKSLGQNFLNNDEVVSRIVDVTTADGDDLVFEIGPGIGSMTKELAERARRVVAIEIDRHLMPALKEIFGSSPNVEIINEDVLKVDFRRLIENKLSLHGGNGAFKKVKVAANLPYYITTPIIMKLLEENPGIDSMVFMVQKEVALRMVAKPGGKDYGALSVAVQFYSKPEIAFNVPPHYFIPQPEVDSTVISLQIHKTPPVDVKDTKMFFRIVKAAFGQRRKTLINALSNAGVFNQSKEQMAAMLGTMGIDERQRGETLSVAQFAELSNLFSCKQSQ